MHAYNKKLLNTNLHCEVVAVFGLQLLELYPLFADLFAALAPTAIAAHHLY